MVSSRPSKADLQGDRGIKRVEVNAAGEVVNAVDSVEPVQGNDIRITIDANVQKVAEEALRRAFADAAVSGNDSARSGAIVCMNCNTGEVIAMASAPSYSPSQFIGGISSDVWEEMTSEDLAYPPSNRCIAGLYPGCLHVQGLHGPGGPGDGFDHRQLGVGVRGHLDGIRRGRPQKCWKTSGHGLIGFHKGIVEKL